MNQGENEQSNGQSTGTESSSSANTSAVGALSPLADPPEVQEYIDEHSRPVGRCFNERNRVKELIAQARAVQAALKAANADYWACRDAAQVAAGIAPANHYRGLFVAATFESIAGRLTELESLIENFQ